MKFLKNTISFMAVLCCTGAAFGVTARPSVIGTASSRMPTMASLISAASRTTTSTTSSALLANAECIDAYTACIKGADACGDGFEECTTKVLFHAKMPQCLSTLAQCSSTGITSLFGTSSVTSLSTVASTNSYGEVTDYTYPTDGSVLGQLITAASISNKYDTSSCVRRYTSCLRKDSVCGSDFELCTTNTEFKKQMVYCDSTLARCQSDGKIELFGSVTATSPSASSRIGELITEGAALAAVNAVSTCYKVVDQCILNACTTNPYKCYENSSTVTTQIADAINNGTTVVTSAFDAAADLVTKSAISAYIKGACLDTVGSNKYCYATFLGDGKMPTSSQLRDEDNQEEVYDEAYASRMNAAMRAKIADLVDAFDTRAKSKCVETIKTCAMRTCGDGNGAVCYDSVFNGNDKSINSDSVRPAIKTRCAAFVNTDANCKYAASNPDSTGGYSYSYINRDAFDILFPEYDVSEPDPIGVIAELNASLANGYNSAALAQMKRQCQAVATSCVKSMCGTDYVNCYRNRTDIYSNLTNTGKTAFDKSMNKVGGVLDYTIVLGLCLDTVKNATVCSDHLAIEAYKLTADSKKTSVWGGVDSVRSGWIDAGGATELTSEVDPIVATDENGNELCTTSSNNGTLQEVCGYVDADGNVYDKKVTIDTITYAQSQAASTLFRDLIYDLEKEVQAIYNAKLTNEQNMCMSSNAGGVPGNRDMGSTYMWVKLRNNKIPTNYSVNGLKDTQFTASNDLYGSFCRVRVNVQSTDPDIQKVLSKGERWATAYFAVGDTFTCGSWIPVEDLEVIADAISKEDEDERKAEQKRNRNWITALSAMAGGTGVAFLADAINDGRAFSGLTGLQNRSKMTTNAEYCVKYAGFVENATDNSSILTYATALKTFAENAGVEVTNLDNKIGELKEAVAEEGDGAAKKVQTAAEEVQTAAKNVKTLCQVKVDSGEDKNEKNRSTFWQKSGGQILASSIGTAVGAAGIGFMAWKATKDIQESTLTKEQQEAYDEWMEDIGNKIQCYIGGDEAGSYGDVITTSIQ